MAADAREWFRAQGRWQKLGIAALAGALMTAGHAPVDLPWAAFLAVPVLVLLVDGAPTGRVAFWIGWAAGFGYFVTGLHWVGHAFLVDADRFAWLLPLGVAVLPAGLAIFWGVAFRLAKTIWPREIVAGAVLLCILWTVLEFARGNILTGFPWALPGYVWVETPVAQAAAWAGPYGLTFLSLILTALPGVALAAGNGPARVWVAALSIGAMVGLWAGGAVRVPDTSAFESEAPVLRIVQPNAPQKLKWLPGHREEFYRRALGATAAPPDPVLGPADLVIWPEMAVFFPPVDYPEQRLTIAAAAAGVPVVTGAFHIERPSEGLELWSNAMVTILPDGEIGPVYAKHHLVPFGEYLPFEPVFSALGLSQFAIRGGFTPGPGPRTIGIGDLPPVSVLICYEAIFPGEVVGETRPGWMLQLTNDAWFGGFAGPQQHLAQARIRAIEQGLPMIRAANTGISAVIDPFGRVLESIALGVYGSMDAQLPAPLSPTPYARTGDWILLLLLGIAGVFVFVRHRRAVPPTR